MRTPMLIAVVAALPLLAAAPATSRAEPYGYRYRAAEQVPQGVGCYWYRGRLNCSRYCYWEIDGSRFCTRRLREAHSQAPELREDETPYPPYRPYRSVK